MCKLLQNKNAYGAAVEVQIAFDCANCEVPNSRPVVSNEIVMEIYDLLPKHYDGMTGLPNITAEDVIVVTSMVAPPGSDIQEISRRVLFFHNEVIRCRLKSQNDRGLKDGR